jgi:sigma-B regulation protein RsbU (phosphoserine phosphatase)
VADVSGKGIAAALLMAELQGAFRALVHTLQRPEHILDTVNRFLCERMEPDRFVTLFYAVVDPLSNELTYVNAGHNPAFVRRKDGRVEMLAEGGLFLNDISKHPYAAYQVPFRMGDCPVVYTDGITDAECSTGHQWGERNLREVVARLDGGGACSAAEQIKDELRAFVGSADQRDDMTLAVVLRT